MKKKKLIFSTILTLLLTCLLIAGCGEVDNSSNNENDVLGNKYTIIAKDNGSELFRFEVESNRFFKIPTDLIPQKTGYIFGGLYEDEEFNYQIIKEDGEGIGTFVNNSDIITYVKWNPKIYTIIYNFGEGIETSADLSCKIEYDSELFEFPRGNKDGYSLEGWYTKEENGKKIAGSNSIVFEEFKKINHENYEIDEETKTINLYSKFTPNSYTINFYDEKGVLIKKKSVQYKDDIYSISEREGICKLEDIYVTSWKEKTLNGDGNLIEKMPCYDIDVMPRTVDKYIYYNTNNKTDLDNQCFHYPAGYDVQLKIVNDEQGVANVGWMYKGKRVAGIITMPNENIILDVLWNNAEVLFNIDGTVIKETLYFDENVNKIERKQFYTANGYICGWKNQDGNEYNIVNDKKVVLYPNKYQPYINFIVEDEVVAKGRCQPGERVSLTNFEIKNNIRTDVVAWKTLNGVICQNKMFTMPENQMIVDLIANLPIHKDYIRNQIYRINDAGRIKNPYDVLDLPKIFGMTLYEMKRCGYTKIKFELNLYLAEINDGWQRIFLGKNPKSKEDKDYVYMKNFEHGSGYLDENWRWHYENFCTIDINNLQDIMYVMYTAEGSWQDDWQNQAHFELYLL